MNRRSLVERGAEIIVNLSASLFAGYVVACWLE
jgi:hypothetical protein